MQKYTYRIIVIGLDTTQKQVEESFAVQYDSPKTNKDEILNDISKQLKQIKEITDCRIETYEQQKFDTQYSKALRDNPPQKNT